MRSRAALIHKRELGISLGLAGFNPVRGHGPLSSARRCSTASISTGPTRHRHTQAPGSMSMRQ
ncbi:hypothetical protein E2562_010568 [Oryza meyeriana var. granulata]|uniref:Uncharacterized protein n=1 Tax=Oryza meyeriana var. granulata TaxID=110450 RepID=A0A6G1BUK2_9ORYZ|nr:hypothetical protein E2562_010568 [Oryza meyeriana var. granulata]